MRFEARLARNFRTGAVAAAIAGAVTIALAVTTVVPSGPPTPVHHAMSKSGAAGTNALLASESSSTQGSSVDQLDQLLSLLESLPADLKDADPASTPGYERRLADAINARVSNASVPAQTASEALVVSTVSFRKSSQSPVGGVPQVRLAANWFACATDIVGLIVQYGIPVGRVIGWIKEARSIFGSLSGIVRAIARGDFAVAVGDDAAEVIEALLGVDGVIADCFG